MSELSTVSVTELKGVGAALAEKLAKVGLETLQDILFHLPLRYQDRTRIVPIGALRPGQDAVVEGTVSGADVVMGKRRSLLVRLNDGSGTLSLRFYHFSNAQKEGLKRGTQVRCYGEVRPGSSGLEIYHPEYRALDGDEPAAVCLRILRAASAIDSLVERVSAAMRQPHDRPIGLDVLHGPDAADPKAHRRLRRLPCVGIADREREIFGVSRPFHAPTRLLDIATRASTAAIENDEP